MTRSLVATAAIIVAIAGCAGAASSSGSGVAGASSPSISPSPASTVSATPRPSSETTAPVPDALRYVWLGPARDIPALGGPLALSIIRFRGSNFDFIFGGQGEEALNSTVSVSAPGQVRFTSSNTSGGCGVDDEGIYDWMTAADGAGLTMTKVSETCSPRGEAVVGDWVRAACKEFGCVGDLEAGTHQTAFFEPLGDPTALTGSWRMQYSSMSYTVPSGWANAVDDPNLYNLVPQDEYAKTVPDATRYPGVILLPDVDVAAQDEACSSKVEPGVGPSAGEIADRIARIPSLEVGPAIPITVAGRSGTMLDVALTDGWSRFCLVDGGVPVLRQGGEATDGIGGWDRRMTATERWRLILVDVAKGRTMAILIDDSSVPSRFDDLVAQAMPIVTSFEFHPPTP